MIINASEEFGWKFLILFLGDSGWKKAPPQYIHYKSRIDWVQCGFFEKYTEGCFSR